MNTDRIIFTDWIQYLPDGSRKIDETRFYEFVIQFLGQFPLVDLGFGLINTAGKGQNVGQLDILGGSDGLHVNLIFKHIQPPGLMEIGAITVSYLPNDFIINIQRFTNNPRVNEPLDRLEKAVRRIEEEERVKARNDHNVASGRDLKHKKWDDTESKIMRLKEFRKKWRKEHNGAIPKWTHACQQVGIDPKTARTHAKELREHWEDKDY